MIQDEDVLRNISENVRLLLGDRGWSQTELAKRTGDPLMTISSVVRGKHMPGAGILARIAEAFHASMERLTAPSPVFSEENPKILQNQR